MSPAPRILVAYATREGQTAKIAEEIENIGVRMGVDVDCVKVDAVTEHALTDRYQGVLVGGSIHLGDFEPELTAFVQRRRSELEALNASFFAVCLTEAEKGDLARETVFGYLQKLSQLTRWHPAMMTAFAGALRYSRYGFVKRFLVKEVARTRQLPTDTEHDYELTDWGSVDAFAEDVIGVAVGKPVAVRPIERDEANAAPL